MNDRSTNEPAPLEPALEPDDHQQGVRKALEQFGQRVRAGQHREQRRPRWRRARGWIGRAAR